MAVNEALISFSLLFPWHLFLVAVHGMRSSGIADGPRPFVTTINHPDAIFVGAMEKLLARPTMCTLCAHTQCTYMRVHICVVAHPVAVLRANALCIFRIFHGRLGRWPAILGGLRPSDAAAEPSSQSRCKLVRVDPTN